VRRKGPPQLVFHDGAARRFEKLGATGSFVTITHSQELAIVQVTLVRVEPVV
jgi:phosphopantetheinyl transferase (holo-ACP synthase)